LRALLFPFKWWHIFIAVVPLSLLEVIEAPVPVMIGLLKEQYETLSIEQIENRMWIKLDKDTIMIGNPTLEEGEKYLYEPYLNNLHAKLKPLYEEIKLIGGKH